MKKIFVLLAVCSIATVNASAQTSSNCRSTRDEVLREMETRLLDSKTSPDEIGIKGDFNFFEVIGRQDEDHECRNNIPGSIRVSTIIDNLIHKAREEHRPHKNLFAREGSIRLLNLAAYYRKDWGTFRVIARDLISASYFDVYKIESCTQTSAVDGSCDNGRVIDFEGRLEENILRNVKEGFSAIAEMKDAIPEVRADALSYAEECENRLRDIRTSGEIERAKGRSSNVASENRNI